MTNFSCCWSVEHVLIIRDSTPRKYVGHGEQMARPDAGQAVQPLVYKSTMQNLKESTGDAVLHHDEDTRAQLMEQQAESVRYLNELNTVCSNYTLNI